MLSALLGRVYPAVLFAVFLLPLTLVGSARAATMPSFDLVSVPDGKTVSSQSFQGKVLVINFWATWCPPCRMEIPGLIALQKKYGDKGFTVVGLTVDQGPREMIQKFMRKNNINYPVLRASPRLGREFGGVVGIPTTFLVDRKGEVVKRLDGFVEQAVIEERVKALVSSR